MLDYFINAFSSNWHFKAGKEKHESDIPNTSNILYK